MDIMAFTLLEGNKGVDFDDIEEIFGFQNLGLLADYSTFVSYDAGCIREQEDSILDEGVSQAQQEHAIAMGLKYGELAIQTAPPEAEAAIRTAQTKRQI